MEKTFENLVNEISAISVEINKCAKLLASADTMHQGAFSLGWLNHAVQTLYEQYNAHLNQNASVAPAASPEAIQPEVKNENS
jgi:hypothetical protein